MHNSTDVILPGSCARANVNSVASTSSFILYLERKDIVAELHTTPVMNDQHAKLQAYNTIRVLQFINSCATDGIIIIVIGVCTYNASSLYVCVCVCQSL